MKLSSRSGANAGDGDPPRVASHGVGPAVQSAATNVISTVHERLRTQMKERDSSARESMASAAPAPASHKRKADEVDATAAAAPAPAAAAAVPTAEDAKAATATTATAAAAPAPAAKKRRWDTGVRAEPVPVPVPAVSLAALNPNIPRAIIRAPGETTKNLALPKKHKERKVEAAKAAALAAAQTAAGAQAAALAAAAGAITPMPFAASSASAATTAAAALLASGTATPAVDATLAASIEKAKAALVQHQIAERMKALGVIPSVAAPAPGAAAGGGGGDIASRLAAAKAALAAKATAALTSSAAAPVAAAAVSRLPAQLVVPAAVPGTVAAALAAAQSAQRAMAAATAASRWAPLRLDAAGREIDASGRVVVKNERATVSTLKINIAHEEKKKEEALMTPAELKRAAMQSSNATTAIDTTTVSNKYFDGNLAAGKKLKERKARQTFEFVEDQKHARAAEALRIRNISREIRTQKITSDTSVSNSAIVRKLMSHESSIPAVEWWDAKVLSGESYDDKPALNRITHFMYMPVAIAPAVPTVEPAPLPLMLTKEESKKMKRKAKMEKQREEHDLIKFGLAPAPEPRLKLNTMSKILGNEAVSDPSALEAKVRRQMHERKSKHETTNAARALTPEQRKAKKLAKLKEDKSTEMQVAVYLVGDLADEKRRLKITRMAEQLTLTGIGLIYIEANVIIVEGGVKALKKFTRLITHRIIWKPANAANVPAKDGAGAGGDGAAAGGDGTATVEDAVTKKPGGGGGGGEDGEPEDDTDDEDTKQYKKAIVVWQGVVPKQSFKNFRFETCRSELMARKYLEDKNCAQYWDLARNFKSDPNAPTH